MTTHLPETKRLFLALAIPESVRTELRRFQEELKPLLPPAVVRWANPEQFHLTLKFLGNVPASDVSALSEAAHAVCQSTTSLHLRAEGAGFFPNERAPSVFWADIKSLDDRLIEFQRRLDVTVQPFAEKDEKKFMAHVTLARFQKVFSKDVEKLVSQSRADRIFGEWRAREVELIESKLQPSGPLHAILDAFRLKNE
jgi:2'-5' RNA ligase